MENLEKILKVLGTNFQSVFTFEQHQEIDVLKEEINRILNEHPEKVSDIYKIIKAIIE